MKTVSFEYGEGMMEAQLPDSAEVFVPGETVPDPPCAADPIAITREAILHPIGMPPIAQLVQKGSTVTISFPDRVKGGAHETSHRKVSIPILIDECLKAGVEKKDIRLICSNGLHRKNTEQEIRTLLGDVIYDAFSPTGQIVNHDSEDWEHLIDLGRDAMSNRVIMNKDVFDSDLPILIGHVLGNPYGGYSGGYKMAATGITHWESIACHHNPAVMHKRDFTPVAPRSEMRDRFQAIGRHMEEKMGRKFFMVDAVLDTQMRQIAVFAGYGAEIEPLSWEVANTRTYVPWASEKFDIMMFGMPQNFHYGNGHGTNPILILQAIAANIIRHKRVLKDNVVIICSSLCNGFFHDEEFTGYRELYERFQHGAHQTLADCAPYGEEWARNQAFIDQYRFHFGYHPFHAFSMIACGHIAEMHASAIYLVGAQEPGYARSMGMKTRATFAEALKDAERYTGANPRILALPRCFKTAAVHLMMKGKA
mgnify:CR=1 FL=1